MDRDEVGDLADQRLQELNEEEEPLVKSQVPAPKIIKTQ
jgi:hypothetical protein